MSKKLYFNRDNEESSCYTLDYWREYIADNGLDDLTLEEAEIEYGTDYFYCAFYFDFSEKNDNTCGKFCEGYEPRNGKNGRCKHNMNCYTGSGRFIAIDRNGKIINSGSK